ncbi:PiggyBac transposable element-derived protein 4 [Trichinella britovi]|uniref:PiggyBac transposable element-derived protein 4 n=1 Tax=Trichinella britovi TaxID=45882 RepID=A0A0V1DIG6_TRIBR|nr:PiggyBac transposable element-derived protein 4 [Trichinella britovi]
MDRDPLVGRGFRGEEVFNTLDGFIKDKRSELDPTVLWTHCNLHGAVLAFKTLPDKLKKGLDISVKITNHIKSRPLQCHLLEVLCEDMVGAILAECSAKRIQIAQPQLGKFCFYLHHHTFLSDSLRLKVTAIESQSQKLKLDEGYFSWVIATAVTNGGWLLYRRDYELFFGQKTDSMDLLTCMTSVSHLVSQTKRLLHNEEGEIPRNGCRIFSSVRAVISATCVEQLPFICLIYPIFSQTVQSLSLILWLRVFYLIVNEMSLTGSDNDGFLDILNDSLEESDIDSASDSDYVEKSDHDSSSEFSGTLSSHSETEEVIHERSDSWIGRDRVCSGNKQEPSKNVRTRAHNIYPGRQGPRSAARHAKTPFEIWSLFMTKDIIDVIVLNTNVYIGKIRAKYVRERSAKDTDENEIKALLGLLLLAGVLQSNRLNLCDLYSTDGTGVEIFSSTMSLQRLRFLLRCLRFDHATRSERKRQDKLAAIRMVFDTFVRNCTENYMHSAHVTIDEVLVSFKGRCPFRMYIPSKVAKYGIKIFELSDSETYYVSKMEVYVGKQNEGPHQMDTSPAVVVKRLCSAIVGTGRNITMDN